MSAAEHTPGEWLIEDSNFGRHLTANGVRLATIETAEDNAGLSAEEAEANAQLIKAAPVMLAALWSAAGSLQQLVDIGRAPPNMKGLRDALAAIASAKGGAQ